MSLNPILKVLSSLNHSGVRYLLMGGQACVLYGAAEFSRDTDVMLLADPQNVDCLRKALGQLRAERIAMPPFSLDYLLRGHTVHFRHRDRSSPRQRRFWLLQCRTPSILCQLARDYEDEAAALLEARPLLTAAAAGDSSAA